MASSYGAGLLRLTENTVNRSSAHWALALECWLAVLHRDLLRVNSFALCLALHAINFGHRVYLHKPERELRST